MVRAGRVDTRSRGWLPGSVPSGTLGRPPLRRALYVSAVVFALGFTVARSLQNARAKGHFGSQDLITAHVAGRVLAEGHNPYDPSVYRPTFRAVRDGFGRPDRPVERALHYPPTAALPVWLLAQSPPRAAVAVALALSVTAWLTLVGVLTMQLPRLRQLLDGGAAWAGVLLIANAFARQNLLLGQPSLVVLAAAWGGTWLVQRGQPFLGGTWLAVATLKPTFVALVLLGPVWTRNARALAGMAWASVVLCLPALVVEPNPWTLLADWKEVVDHYQTLALNAPGHPTGVGLASALVALGVPMPGGTSLALAAVGLAVGTIVIGPFARTAPMFFAAAGLAWAVLCVPAHDYDLVAILPLTAVAFCVPRGPWRTGLAVAASLCIFLPSSLAGLLGPAQAWVRELGIVGLLGACWPHPTPAEGPDARVP